MYFKVTAATPEDAEAARIAQAMLDSMPESVRQQITQAAIDASLTGEYPDRGVADRLGREWLNRQT